MTMVRAIHLLMESANTGHAESHAHGAVYPEAIAEFERVGMHSIACTVKVDPCTGTIKDLFLFFRSRSPDPWIAHVCA
jgi:hypothetical protein